MHKLYGKMRFWELLNKKTKRFKQSYHNNKKTKKLNKLVTSRKFKMKLKISGISYKKYLDNRLKDMLNFKLQTKFKNNTKIVI